MDLSAGTTIIPPGCCPVVFLAPSHPFAILVSSAFLLLISGVPSTSSKYFFTYPKAFFSARVAIVPALNTFSEPNSSSVYLCISP